MLKHFLPLNQNEMVGFRSCFHYDEKLTKRSINCTQFKFIGKRNLHTEIEKQSKHKCARLCNKFLIKKMLEKDFSYVDEGDFFYNFRCEDILF